jgi:drug/metabolite transporter (DMT)-like permease
MIFESYAGLLFGLIMATIDLFALAVLKNISLKKYSINWMIFASLIYACQPWIFLKGLNFTSMTILNLSWDLFSDILVTLSGLLIFKEAHTKRELLGICFALVAIYLFATDKQYKKRH